jgi:hypothetical protein
VHGILELRTTIARLTERLAATAPELIVLLTRWQPQRISSRRIEDALIGSDLPPAVWVRSRSAAVARAASARVPLALSAPDSSVTLAYQRLVEQLRGVIAR